MIQTDFSDKRQKKRKKNLQVKKGAWFVVS